jgi:hypothetical protein
MKVLIAGVGYYNLRDLSFGPLMLQELQKLDWPENLEFDDFSFGPIAVVQRMQDRPGYFDRVVFLAGVGRKGRVPSGLYCYRWQSASPSNETVQQSVTEGVTGVVSLDNLLVIGDYFKVWPAEVVVIEVEPLSEDWGAEYSEPVQAVVAAVPGLVREVALGSLDQLNSNPLEIMPLITISHPKVTQ